MHRKELNFLLLHVILSDDLLFSFTFFGFQLFFFLLTWLGFWLFYSLLLFAREYWSSWNSCCVERRRGRWGNILGCSRLILKRYWKDEIRWDTKIIKNGNLSTKGNLWNILLYYNPPLPHWNYNSKHPFEGNAFTHLLFLTSNLRRFFNFQMLI